MQKDDNICTIEKSKSVKNAIMITLLNTIPPYALIVADSSVCTSFFGAFVAFDATALVPAEAAPNTVSIAFTTPAIIYFTWN
jgi:hypothetical protein